MINEREKLAKIKALQEDSIRKSLRANHKLDILKDKSHNLELKAKLFAESQKPTPMFSDDFKKKWQFILLGTLLVGFASLLLGAQLPYCIFYAFSGGLLSYALYRTGTSFRAISLPNLGLSDFFEDEPPKTEAHPKSKASIPNPIHPAFDQTKKKQPSKDSQQTNKISFPFKK